MNSVGGECVVLGSGLPQRSSLGLSLIQHRDAPGRCNPPEGAAYDSPQLMMPMRSPTGGSGRAIG